MAETNGEVEVAVEEPIEHVIDAMEMTKGGLYLTFQSRARYYVEFLKLDSMKDEVEVRAYYPNYAEWRVVKVPTSYKMKELTLEEQQKAYEQISRSTHATREKFSEMSNKPKKAPGTGRSRGQVTGLGMLETWGKYFQLHAHKPNMRELIREDMKKEFPNKHDSVDRWLDAYRTYFNKGKLPGATIPEKLIELKEWMAKEGA